MTATTIGEILSFLEREPVATLDITGGAPELNPGFRDLVCGARGSGTTVIDRCNLTILEEPGQEDLADFLANEGVQIVASLPCYLQEDVDAQRGRGVFDASIRALQRLNALGYGSGRPDRTLSLVYNPRGPTLPPSQCVLEGEYKAQLAERYGIHFDRLLTLANMPIKRFGSWLQSSGQFATYLDLLKGSHREANLDAVMCRDLISVDWQGYLYDCDFNQMLDLPLFTPDKPRWHIRDLVTHALIDREIRVGDHCYGCTAGQGSSCAGALSEDSEMPAGRRRHDPR